MLMKTAKRSYRHKLRSGFSAATQSLILWAGGLLMAFTTCAQTSPITTNVSAMCNIYGAGHSPPNDTPTEGSGGGGIAPAAVSMQALSNAPYLEFLATGAVSFCNGCGSNGPDGTNFFTSAPSYNGISGISNFPARSLIGVFTSETQPTNPAPPSLDFSAIGINSPILAPQLCQLFYIGDGLKGVGPA